MTHEMNGCQRMMLKGIVMQIEKAPINDEL